MTAGPTICQPYPWADLKQMITSRVVKKYSSKAIENVLSFKRHIPDTFQAELMPNKADK